MKIIIIAVIIIAVIILLIVNAWLITIYVDKSYQHQLSLMNGFLTTLLGIYFWGKISKQ